jgi:hypothetical protein
MRALRPRSDALDLRWFPDPVPPRARPFLLDEFAVPADGRSIRVFPEIPPGETVWLALRPDVVPDFGDDGAEVPDGAVPALTQWALHRAKGMDAENNPAIMYAARDHKETFFLLLGMSIGRARHAARRDGGSGGEGKAV